MALNEFEGTLMLVSHDRALLRAVCDEFWLVGRGVIAPFDGDLDDYQRYLLDESKRLREEARESLREDAANALVEENLQSSRVVGALAADSSASHRDQRRLDALSRQQLADKTKPLRRELERCEHALETHNKERSQLEAKLATPLPPAELAQAGKRLKALHDLIASVEARWLELTEQIETATL
jgi:ATP-binding cassette subfamily F protein 3